MRELLPLLPKPSRYAGIEEGACRKNADAVNLRIALAFPDTYEVGMSYLGQKILYSIVNSCPRWLAERVMAPELEAAAVLRAHKAPLCTLESDTPLKNLHCVAFSVTHELCYTNILYMLDLAAIPLRTAGRPEDMTACPLVIAGGGALLSAEALAPFMDIMVLGDGEESLPDVLRLLETAMENGWGRSRLLRETRLVSGVYVPSLFGPSVSPCGPPTPLFADHARPSRRIVADLNTAPYPVKQITPVGAVHNRLALEIARGCTRGCRFCHAGMVYRPVRERSVPGVMTLVRDCLKETGFDEISFLALSAGDFSALKTLCRNALDHCAAEQVSLSLPSLRVGSIDDEILERMAELRRTGCTLAPEAGSQRLRDVINKGVSEEDLLLHVQKLLEHGWRQVKLYFMIGLPTETDEDIAAIAELCRKVRDAAGRGAPRMQVTAAVSPFVPKPFTPFQWEAQISSEEMSRRIDLLRDIFRGQKCLKLRWHEPAMSRLEGILSRADRRMADVVEKAFHKGAVFCSWADSFDLAPWLAALEESGLDAEAFTGPRTPGAPLAWSHLEIGISENFLLRERARAFREKISGDCRYNVCRQCGACDTKAGSSRLPRVGTNTHANRLVFPMRDQNAHLPARDAEGQLICRARANRPPQIAAALTVKAATYRIWHSKTEGCAFLSQLELQAVLDRALRRAALPSAFSQGFHPLPLLSFGRALPVGVQSLAEWFVITLRTALAPETVAQRLSPVLPPGMDVIRVEKFVKSRRTELASKEKFSLSLHACKDDSPAARCFEQFAALDAFAYLRKTKNGLRSTDIRPLLHSWEIPPPDTAQNQQTRRGGATVTFTADWRTVYLSPLAFCLAILKPLGREDALRLRVRLTKTAQIFAGADMPAPNL